MNQILQIHPSLYSPQCLYIRIGAVPYIPHGADSLSVLSITVKASKMNFVGFDYANKRCQALGKAMQNKQAVLSQNLRILPSNRTQSPLISFVAKYIIKLEKENMTKITSKYDTKFEFILSSRQYKPPTGDEHYAQQSRTYVLYAKLQRERHIDFDKLPKRAYLGYIARYRR